MYIQVDTESNQFILQCGSSNVADILIKTLRKQI